MSSIGNYGNPRAPENKPGSLGKSKTLRTQAAEPLAITKLEFKSKRADIFYGRWCKLASDGLCYMVGKPQE